MLVVTEIAAPLHLSAGVHELRVFDSMILAACNHQVSSYASSVPLRPSVGSFWPLEATYRLLPPLSLLIVLSAFLYISRDEIRRA